MVVALVAVIGAFGVADEASAGELAWKDCVTENPEIGPSGSGACVQIPNSGLAGPTSVALSPDGKSLYTAGYARVGASESYAMSRFDRDPATGALTYRGCITGDSRLGGSGSGRCDEIPGATKYGLGTGLQGVLRVTVSPDGNSVYTGGYFNVARFDRDPTTATLTYRGCITGDKRSGPSGSGACDEIPSAGVDGVGSGLGELTGVAVSPDGVSLYGTSPAGVARFDRDPASGALTWRGCISAARDLGPSGSGACALIPSASRRADSGLSPESLSVSPDGKSLYTGSRRECDMYDCYGSSGVARFDRDPATGALTWGGCITGDKRSGPSGSGGCAAIPSASDRGQGSGLGTGILALAPSLDGASLYTASCCRHEGSLVARFGFAPQTRITKRRTHGHKAVFRFRASEGSTFECKLKGKHVKHKRRRWRHCGSTGFERDGKKIYRHLRPGRKVFKVRATDGAGTTDPTPAKRRWRVR